MKTRAPYAFQVEKWVSTPIVRKINPITGMIEGDDSGYRRIKTLAQNTAPLVVPDIIVRPSYDGIDEFGKKRDEIALPGGLFDGKLVVRETFAKDLSRANKLLEKAFGGAYRLAALDGFRSWVRQAAGFTRLLRVHMERLGVTENNLDDRVLDFIRAGNLADGTFSWVNADVTSVTYGEVMGELLRDDKFMAQLKEYAVTLKDVKDQMTEAMYVYITISANSGIGRAANRGIPLIFEGNAHAGGGACDIFLVNARGIPLNHVPFDWSGPEAGMDYLENGTNFGLFKAKIATEPVLAAHVKHYGITAENFQWKHWEILRDAIRVLYHLTKAMGWTYYSSDHGGENWHIEGGNIGYNPLTGEVVYVEEGTHAQFPDSGNPGHALQISGREATAVWGGASGHLLAKPLGLQI